MAVDLTVAMLLHHIFLNLTTGSIVEDANWCILTLTGHFFYDCSLRCLC